MKLFSLIFTLIITCSSVFATNVTIPNSFSSGTATNAAQMNANFSAVKAAVDDNDSRISALEGSSTSQFMGFSSSQINGDGGYIAMGNACHATFSGSHMCRQTEFVNARMNGVSVSGSAWITPRTSVGVNGSGSDSSCSGWRDTNGAVNGAVITAAGALHYSACNVTTNYVACCKY
tara:strand:+ start:290 stop:817 length:528 start_codon:yes stop_codon:yes gene_type:complete